MHSFILDFEENYQSLEEYHNEKGHSHVSEHENPALYQWCLMLRRLKKKKLTPEQIELLARLEFAWTTEDYVWWRKLESFKSGDPERAWCGRQRLAKKNLRLTKERIRALNDADFCWDKK